MKIAALQCHPVKGFSPEAIDGVVLEAGGHFPNDRLFAIENGPSGFDPAAAEHLPKQKFLMLMRHERLARLRLSYDADGRRITIRQGNGIVAAGAVDDAEGRLAITRFLETYLGEECRGPLRLITAPPGHRFMDSRHGHVSLINLASLQAIAPLTGRDAIHPARFRANIHLDGLPAWSEFDLVGRRLAIGDAELEVVKRIDRCAAVDVDPVAGLRDLRLVQALERAFQHHDCGIYARIVTGGTIRVGDPLRLL